MRWKWTVTLVAAGWAAGQSPDPLSVATANDTAAGKRIFDSQCALCHGIGGTGGRGPALTRAKMRHAADGSELIDVIVGGVNGTGMPVLSGRRVCALALREPAGCGRGGQRRTWQAPVRRKRLRGVPCRERRGFRVRAGADGNRDAAERRILARVDLRS